jgi:hypothetical protein
MVNKGFIEYMERNIAHMQEQLGKIRNDSAKVALIIRIQEYNEILHMYYHYHKEDK